MLYIGRNPMNPHRHFGNPFSHLVFSYASIKVDTRDEAIECFRQWIRGEAYQDIEPKRRQWILDHLELLRDKDLVCWCSPLPCHGEIYLEMLNE